MIRRRNFNEQRTCWLCGRVGTHAFTKDQRGHTICQSAQACLRRVYAPLYRVRADAER